MASSNTPPPAAGSTSPRATRAFTLLDALALAVAIAVGIGICAPILADLTKWGGHDWDSGTTHRYFVAKAIKTFHQFPFWNPYACGGFDAWGFAESDTIVVSPWLPAYLAFDTRIALRIEVIGTLMIAISGTWMLAGRFTKSSAARALVCVVWAANGRWALQIAVGHLWHLYYAWVPWTLYCYERAHGAEGPRWQPGWWRWSALAGVCVALMVYAGALYPLPHTAMLLGLYGVALALLHKRVQPLFAGAITALVGFALGAPKLLPIIDEMAKSPRHVESTETMDLGAFVQMLISKNQDLSSRPAPVPQWGWHEWGIYIGAPSLLLLGLGFSARGGRQRALKFVTFALILLGFGAFHEHAPWTHLHEYPPFRSLHVPSRWLYPAVLTCALLAASLLGRWIETRPPLDRSIAELLAIGCVAWIGFDIATVANAPMSHAFWMEMPPALTESRDNFHQEPTTPPEFHYVKRDWSIPSLPAEIANVGVVECYAVGTLSIYARDPLTGKPPGQGAIGRGGAGYQGEVFLKSGKGTVRYSIWSPNVLEIEVVGAEAQDTLIINQNFDDGWRVDGAPARRDADRIATIVAGGTQRIRFAYRPRRLARGLVIAGTTTLLIGLMLWLERRARIAGTTRLGWIARRLRRSR